MVVQLIRHGSAVKNNASVSAAVRQDNDRVIENVRLEWVGEIHLIIKASQLRRLAAPRGAPGGALKKRGGRAA